MKLPLILFLIINLTTYKFLILWASKKSFQIFFQEFFFVELYDKN